MAVFVVSRVEVVKYDNKSYVDDCSEFCDISIDDGCKIDNI